MLSDPQWLEEISDLVSIAEARGQKGLPLEVVVAEVQRERKRVVTVTEVAHRSEAYRQ